jgi:integrase
MATIKYLLQSDKENSNIYLRYSVGRASVWKRKTGFVINSKNWSIDKAQPLQKTDELKALKFKLDKLAIFINEAYNKAISTGDEVDGDWLQYQIDLFNNKIVVVDLDVLTNAIDYYIAKGDKLTSGSIKNLENFKKFFIKYENECLRGKSILIRNINMNFIDTFKSHFLQKGYSTNYIGTYLSLLISVVNKVSLSGIPTHSDFSQIKAIKKTKEPDEIIILTEEEQLLIKNTELTREALINARKWLLLGCLIGQRAGDLLNLTENNIKEYKGVKVIELKQKKTGKLMSIGLFPDAVEIIESGFPYKINLEHFNKYCKEICKEAKINTLVKGKMRINNTRILTVGVYEKWQVISSHVCRRSFATNFYSKIPTPFLMSATGHSTEEMFLRYIGKASNENAFQMIDYFNKITPKQ